MNRLKRNGLYRTTILLTFFTITLSGAMFSYIRPASALAVWDQTSDPSYTWGWISPEGYKYYERYRFIIYSQGGSYSNEPVRLRLWFPDGRATLDSLRVLYIKDITENYTELPYVVNGSSMYSSGYLKTVELIFVAPIIGTGIPYFLTYSSNTTFAAPDYSGQWLTVGDNHITDFYDENNGQFVSSLDFNYDSGGNRTAEILIPSPSVGKDVNITSANFNYSVEPRFYIQSRTALESHYNNMGPVSLKLFDGATYGQTGKHYLLVGSLGNLSIFQYNQATNKFDPLYNITIPKDQNGNYQLVGGMTLANVVGVNDDPELVFALFNGTYYIYTFDGVNAPSLLYSDYLNNSAEIITKPYGIAGLPIVEDQIVGTSNPSLIIAGPSASAGSTTDRYIQGFYHNASIANSIYQFETQSIPEIGYYSNANNYSYNIYTYANHNAKTWENFFISTYDNDQGGTTLSDRTEYLMAFPYNNYVCVGVYQPEFDANLNITYIFPRLRDSGSDYAQLVPSDVDGGVGGIAYSKKFTDNQTTYTVVGAGTLSGDLQIIWKRFYTTENSSTYSLTDMKTGKGYMELIGSTDDRIVVPNYGDAVLSPVWGNLDNIDTSYDDVVFFDNHGNYMLITYDTTTQKLVKRIDGSLFGTDIDLYGTGSSMDAFDYSGDGISDIIIGDPNGYINFLNFTFVENLTVWAKNGSAASDYEKTSENLTTFTYTDKTGYSGDLTNAFNSYLGTTQKFVNGKFWTNCSVNVQIDTPGKVQIDNLDVVFETNDYLLTTPNRRVNVIFDETLQNEGTAFLQYADFDQDGLSDYWEEKGILVWSGSITWQGETYSFPDYTTFDIYSNRTYHSTYGYNDTLPTNLHTDLNSNDTDGDGIPDGVELLIYGTNPNSTDTDGDGLSDYEEIFNSQYSPDPRLYDTDGDGLNDKQDIYFGASPNNKNTDNDEVLIVNDDGEEFYKGLDDREEALIYHTNPASNDTDGDGLTDLQELGIWNLNKQGDELTNFLYSKKSPNGNYGTIKVYAKTDEFIQQYYPSLAGFLEVGLDPTNPDTDGDGLSDYVEIMQGYSISVGIENKTFFSDPLDMDTDGDGLYDGVEIHFSFSYYKFYSNGTKYLYTTTGTLNPDDADTDDDKLMDGNETNYWHTDPLYADTDHDYIIDGDEVLGFSLGDLGTITTDPVNPDSDGDGLLDGEERDGKLYSLTGNPAYYYFQMGKRVLYSDPNNPDTDGDGWSDYDEVMKYHTSPILADTDGDKIPDPEDDMPVLNNNLAGFYYFLSVIAYIGSVVAVPLNRYSANKAMARKFLYKERLQKATKRMAQERAQRRAFEAKANAIPSDDPNIFTVKINVKIIDPSFFGQACRVHYSAGASEFVEAEAKKEGDDRFSYKLLNIPVDTRVLYYLEFLDRSGNWVRDDNDGKMYQFATNKDGSIDEHSDDDWVVNRGVKCSVCGYMCLPEWDECPECGTPLHDDPSLSILQDDAKKKEEILKRERDLEKIAWEEAQQTDEVWRGLPPCPGCGVSVQPDWASCPVCGFDLTSVELKKHAVYEWVEADMDYIEGKDEEEIKTEYQDDTEHVKSERELLEEMEKEEEKKKKDAWNQTDEDIDIL